MGGTESKTSEGKIEHLQDEELDTVAGGLFGITIYDRCSSENPERNYMPALCNRCENFQKRYNRRKEQTEFFCRKVQRIMHSYRGRDTVYLDDYEYDG